VRKSGEIGPRGAIGRRDLLRAGAGLGAAGLLAACSSSGSTKPHNVTAASGKRGGSLKLGLTGGSSSDTVTPGLGVADIDYARIFATSEPLVWLEPSTAQVQFVLAESIEPDNGSLTRFVIKLRQGVTFHSGKPLTAEDVIYTFRRILTSKPPLSGSSPLSLVDLASTKALDTHTVLVSFTKPNGTFVDQIASLFAYLPIVPNGYTSAEKPNGTGPFIYKSFTPGQSSVFTRNPNYWQTGLPYVDELTILDFADSVSLQDALMTGVIHGAGLLEGPQMATLSSTSGVVSVPSKAGNITPFTMRVDQPPFNDVRVRQAFRLMIDRPQLIDSALDGFGTVASDVFSPFDPDFDASLVRHTDITEARALLKAAGHQNTTFTLVTSAVSTGTVAMATVLAEQARAAGFKINLSNVPSGTFFGPNYLKWGFSQDYYPYDNYAGQVAYSMLPTSPFNETHQDNAHYNNLFAQANATSNAGLRKEIFHEMQQFDFTEGGYIIPAFIDALDAYSSKISGYATDCKQGNPLSNFNFKTLYFK
jgi:peptide/nickel transport system substrate-binding protein